MKRSGIVLLSLFLMVGAISDASASNLGLGGFFGMNIPVAQDNASSGSLYGLRARYEFIPNLGAELTYFSIDQGESSVDVWGQEMTIDEGSLNTFGLNIIFGSMSSKTGAHFHFSGGIGSYSFSRDGVPDESRLGYNFGPAIEIGLGEVSVEVDGKMHIIPLDGGGTKKSFGITGGLNYYFNLGSRY